jgi:hypothetical protein
LQGLLDSAYGPGAFEVVNHGVSGCRADQVLLSLETLNWVANDPYIVLLMVGGNDFAQEMLIYGLAATIDRTVARCKPSSI